MHGEEHERGRVVGLGRIDAGAIEARGLAMLGEGNTSARIDENRFLVKASGTSLGILREEDVLGIVE